MADLAVARAADVVVLSTATPGGGFPAYGEAFAQTIREVDATLDVQPRNSTGSVENVALLESGTVDLGLVQGEVAYEAFNGIGRAPSEKLRIIAAMYATPGMFVVRANAPFRRIQDLKGQAVAFGARGSGLVLLARYVLKGLGLDADRDFKAVYLERAGDGPAMVQDGRVAALWGAGLGWPGFTVLANGPGGARFIAPDDEEISAVIAKAPFLRRLTIPAGSYAGQDRAIQSVGSWSFVLARASLPNDIAYRLAQALHRGEGALAGRLPQARETTAANTVAAAPRTDLIHPGTRRYLQEIGLVK
ncbi:immunogenic protein precursor [Verrucomicrobia bacterium SCGC AG-212-E04]|nr:immunogenic protein precursor [Verrucomicrobia bacterium SCGC AG-212-E04]